MPASDQHGSARRVEPVSAAPPSRVEQVVLARSGYEFRYGPAERIPTLVVPNFPALGRLSALRFLEWVLENPEGVVSLPTGKTPEALQAQGLPTARRPELSGLRFVQMDEF